MSHYPDISHWNIIESWDDLKQSAGFLILKATEGLTRIDPKLKDYVRNCEEKKIPYWLYAYLRKGNELPQTQFLVRVGKRIVGECFQGYVLDIEEDNKEANCISALNWLKIQSEKTMIYIGWSDRNQYKNLIDDRGDNCAWWEARYLYNEGDSRDDGEYHDSNPPHKGVDLHQFTANGHCPGIEYTCDLNRLTGEKPLSWFTGQQIAEPVNDEKIRLPQRGYYMLGDGYERLKSAKPEIKKVQKLCNSMVNAGLKVDGKYGEKTINAVKALQKFLDVKVDGLFGEKTLQAAERKE